MWIQRVRFVLLIFNRWNANNQEIWEIILNEKLETYKKMERKLIDITLPRMEDKPKSLDTQRDKGTLIKLGDSWITQELRRITLTKIDEMNLVYFLNKTQLAFIDENGSTYIGALSIRITKDTKFQLQPT